MSLLKWKEMAEKRSELGKKINTVRETIKQKTISDQMGEVEAEKLFKPITSGLKDLTLPKMPLRRLPRKKRPVPDYSLEIGDDEDVPDYGLEDLFGDQVLPQNDKQLVPKPPSYEDVLKDLASGEKQMYIDPEFMYEPEDLPPGYKQEGPDYEIISSELRLDHSSQNPPPRGSWEAFGILTRNPRWRTRSENKYAVDARSLVTVGRNDAFCCLFWGKCSGYCLPTQGKFCFLFFFR